MIFKSMQTVCVGVCVCVRLHVESYHIELFPHGTPVSQRRCHLCDDRVFNRDDRLKLPTKHTHMQENKIQTSITTCTHTRMGKVEKT